MKTIIKEFQEKIGQIYNQFIFSASTSEAGIAVLSKSNPNDVVSLNLGGGLRTEAITYRELLSNGGFSTTRIVSLYQNLLVSAHNDFLDELFSALVDKHFEGSRRFAELKKIEVKLDFGSPDPLDAQLVEVLKKDFSFKKYDERMKLINNILNPNGKITSEAELIKKHVLIRNAIQHHDYKVYPDMLSKLGTSSLSILNSHASLVEINCGETIGLSVPELDLLKRSLYLLSQEWKKNV